MPTAVRRDHSYDTNMDGIIDNESACRCEGTSNGHDAFLIGYALHKNSIQHSSSDISIGRPDSLKIYGKHEEGSKKFCFNLFKYFVLLRQREDGRITLKPNIWSCSLLHPPS